MITWVMDRLRPLDFPGKRRLLSPLLPGRGQCRATVFGAHFELDLAELIQREMYLGTFENHESRAVAAILRSGGTFVDVGANAGFFTALAARAVGPGGRVIAFEPSPRAYGRLRRMVERNQLSQVESVQAALSHEAGTQTLYLGRNSTNHSPSLVPHADILEDRVDVRTLDAEADRLGIGMIDLLKIDVEGYEPRVLAGASGLMAVGRIRCVLCEFSPPWLQAAGSSCAALEAQMEGAGLRPMRWGKPFRGSPNRIYTMGD